MEHFRSRFLRDFPPVRLTAPAIYAGSSTRAELDSEVQELCRLLDGKTWLELKPNDVRALVEYLTLMSEEAFIAYLPAFLEVGTVDLACGDEGVISIVLLTLSPRPANGGRSQCFPGYRNSLRGNQAKLILEWLLEISGFSVTDILRDDIDRAIRSFQAQSSKE